jgi:hypothetical protein
MEIKMKDFRTQWKNLAHTKSITAEDVVNLCILRAMRSKGDTEEVLKHLLHKAFSPRNFDSNPYRAIGENAFRLTNMNPKLFRVPVEEILEGDEINEFNSWIDGLRSKPAAMIRHYSYFFTRQDISPEYQLVQTAHAALELGATLTPEQVKNLHFTCIGVADGEELAQVEGVLKTLGLRYIAFREPDFANRITSIAVEPIAENHHKRRMLRGYKLLSFRQQEEQPMEDYVLVNNILGE